MFASEAKIPLSGSKGTHAFGPRFLTPLMGERNGATNECALIRRDAAAVKGNRTYMTYFFPTATILSISFGSSGSTPDLGKRGVSVTQFLSIANTLRNSGNDSST